MYDCCLCGISLDIHITNDTGYLWGGFLGVWGQGQEEAFFTVNPFAYFVQFKNSNSKFILG